MKLIRLALPLLLAGLLGGCAGVGGYSASEDPTTEAHRERLAQRVLGFWKHMEKHDFEKAYDYYDPFMRAAIDRRGFARSRTEAIVYSDPSVADMLIRGRIADVTVRVNLEIRELMVAPGKKQSAPPTPRDLKVRWLWIDGDWYHQFVGPKDLTFAHY